MKTTKQSQLDSYKQKQYESIGINAVKIMLLELYQDKPELFKGKTKSILMRLGIDNVTSQKIADSSTKKFFKSIL